MEPTLFGFLAVTAVRSLLTLIGHLSGGNTFPKPFSPQEERHYLERMAQGDEAARNRLIEHNLRLVAHIIKKFDGSGEDPEDLLSIGTIGLIKGIETFRPEKGTKLATYAARCIENEVLMHLRSTRRLKQEVFLQEPIGADHDGNEITLMDVMQDESEPVTEQVMQRLQSGRLREYLKALGPRERRVLELRYGLDGSDRRTQREIAREMGISRSYVSRIEKKALSRLVKILEPETGRSPASASLDEDDEAEALD